MQSSNKDQQSRLDQHSRFCQLCKFTDWQLIDYLWVFGQTVFRNQNNSMGCRNPGRNGCSCLTPIVFKRRIFGPEACSCQCWSCGSPLQRQRPGSGSQVNCPPLSLSEVIGNLSQDSSFFQKYKSPEWSSGAGLPSLEGLLARQVQAAPQVFFWHFLLAGGALGRASTSANCYQQINLLTELLSMQVH